MKNFEEEHESFGKFYRKGKKDAFKDGDFKRKRKDKIKEARKVKRDRFYTEEE